MYFPARTNFKNDNRQLHLFVSVNVGKNEIQKMPVFYISGLNGQKQKFQKGVATIQVKQSTGTFNLLDVARKTVINELMHTHHLII